MTLRPVQALLIALLLSARAAALDLAAVRACLVANAPTSSARIALDLRSEDAAGRLTLQQARVLWRRFSPGERRVLLRIDAPVNMAGSALLAIARQGELPEVHLYLQEIGRAHRVRRAEQLRGFLGRSGVELAELWRLIEPNGELAERLVEDGGQQAGRPVWVVQGELRRPRQASVERVVSHIDQASCVAIRVETWDSAGRLQRILSVDPTQLMREQGRWVPREISFEDLGSGSHGTVRMTSFELDASIAPGLFTVKSLGVGP